jgi:hypothetical protein
MIREISAYVYETTRRHIPVHPNLNSVETRPCWKSNSRSASQKIPRLRWNPDVYCRDFTLTPVPPSFIILYNDQQMHN